MESPPPPQGFSQYPRPQVSPSGVRPLPPGVHIEAIGEAFTLFQRDWGTWVLATLIGAVCFGTVYLLGVLYLGLAGMGSKTGFDSAGIAFLLIYWVLLICIQFLFQFGLVSMALKKLHGQDIQVLDVFGAARHLPRLIGASFCMGLITIISCVACIIPGFWAIGAFSFTPYLILDQDLGVVEALETSYKAAGNFMVGLSVFGMIFLFGLLTGIGECACFVGLLATVPLGIIAAAVQYYYFFPEAFSSPQTVTPPTSLG